MFPQENFIAVARSGQHDGGFSFCPTLGCGLYYPIGRRLGTYQMPSHAVKLALRQRREALLCPTATHAIAEARRKECESVRTFFWWAPPVRYYFGYIIENKSLDIDAMKNWINDFYTQTLTEPLGEIDWDFGDHTQ